MQIWSNNGIRGRLLRGGTWSLFGSAISQVLALIGMAISARFLGPAEYGEVTLVQNTVQLSALMAAPSFGLTASKYLSQNLANDRAACGTLISTLLALGIVIPVVFVLCLSTIYPLLIERFNAVQVISNHTFTFSALFILSAFNSVQLGVLSGLEDFKGIAISNLVKGVLMAISVPVAASYAKSSGAISGMVLACAVSVIVTTILVDLQRKRYGITRSSINLFAVKEPLVRFTLPAAVSSAATLPVIWWSNAQLAQSANGLHELGLFNAANQWRLGVVMVLSLTTAPMLPVISSIYAAGDFARLSRTIRIVSMAVGISSVGLCALTYLFGDYIITALFGVDFREAKKYLVVLTLSTVFSNISSIYAVALQTSNSMWLAFFANLIWSVIFGVICFFMPTPLGVSWAFVCAYLMQVIACAIFLSNRLDLRQVP